MVSFGQFKRVNCSPQCKIHGKSIRPVARDAPKSMQRFFSSSSTVFSGKLRFWFLLFWISQFCRLEPRHKIAPRWPQLKRNVRMMKVLGAKVGQMETVFFLPCWPATKKLPRRARIDSAHLCWQLSENAAQEIYCQPERNKAFRWNLFR